MTSVFGMRLFLTCFSLSLLLFLSIIGSGWSSSTNNATVIGANNTAANVDEVSLQKLLTDYVNWNINLPTEQLPEEGNQCVIKPGQVYLLLDPFSKGTVSQTCDIKSGVPILFPFYEGWCDNGTLGMYGVQDYKKILDCTLDSDKGIVTMVAWLDGKEIVNTKVNNKDVHNLKVLNDKYPGNKYYKVILTPSFIDITLTNKTRFGSDAYEKPEDFQSSSYTYKGLAHCFCGFITGLSPGNHDLRYKTIIEGSAGLAGDKGWDQETDITYKFNVK